MDIQKKCGGVEPKELEASWAPNRISFRKEDYRLFRDSWQAYPQGGYNLLFKKLSENCNIILNYRITPNSINKFLQEYDFVFNTLPIDEIYNFSEGKLEYRGLTLDLEVVEKEHYWSNNLAWVNYPNTEDFCRICEFKHINQTKSSNTLLSREFPTDKLRHYPVYTPRNSEIFKAYLKKISQEDKMMTAGRLGLFLYLPMDKTVEISKEIINIFNEYPNLDADSRYLKYLDILKIYNRS